MQRRTGIGFPIPIQKKYLSISWLGNIVRLLEAICHSAGPSVYRGIYGTGCVSIYWICEEKTQKEAAN